MQQCNLSYEQQKGDNHTNSDNEEEYDIDGNIDFVELSGSKFIIK